MSLATAVYACAGACIIPDKEIDVTDVRFSNKFAVRLLEPTLLSVEATKAADAKCGNLSDDEECPQPGADPAETVPHFLDNSLPKYNFCSCAQGQIDDVALSSLTLYVEDQDEVARSRVPKDSIYAALLLDLDPADKIPHLSVAYANYLDPNEALGLAEFDLSPILRRNPHLRQLTLGNDQPVDLCNGAYAEPLDPGYHTLKIMVTDRPWFKHTPEKGSEITHAGVPDLAAGATYDSVTYVFHCDTVESQTCDPATLAVTTSNNCTLRCRDPAAVTP